MHAARVRLSAERNLPLSPCTSLPNEENRSFKNRSKRSNRIISFFANFTANKLLLDTVYKVVWLTQSSCSVVVITLASHARGLRFEPGQEHAFIILCESLLNTFKRGKLRSREIMDRSILLVWTFLTCFRI